MSPNPYIFLQYDFTTCVLTSLGHTDDPNTPPEALSFAYGAVTTSVTALSAQGQPLQPTTVNWNIQTQKVV